MRRPSLFVLREHFCSETRRTIPRFTDSPVWFASRFAKRIRASSFPARASPRRGGWMEIAATILMTSPDSAARAANLNSILLTTHRLANRVSSHEQDVIVQANQFLFGLVECQPK